MDVSKYLSGLALDRSKTKPLYLQAAELIGQKILNRILPTGTRLPPERELAGLLGVSRTTAINAYRQLEQQCLVITRGGSGTYVSELEDAAVEEVAPGVPWPQLFTPGPRDALSSIIRELLDSSAGGGSISMAVGAPDPSFYPAEFIQQVMAGYPDKEGPHEQADLGHMATEGYLPLRGMLGDWLAQKGIEVTQENLLVSTGSQQGIYLAAKVLLEPGDYVVVESPTYIGAHQVFRARGARILTLPMENAFPLGLLEDYLIRHRPKLLYTMPTYHNPTGRVMPLRERKELLRLAARHRLVILEDDPYSELFYGEQPPLSLKALDHYGGVIYLGTFSKILCPGLRTGYVAAHPAVINRLALEKQFVDLHSNNLSQWLIYKMLKEGFLQSHLESVRGEYKKRRDALSRGLLRHCGGRLSFDDPGGGFYLWCSVRPPVSYGRLLQQCSREGVSLVPGEAFFPAADSRGEIRLCFASNPENILTEGARRLARALGQSPGPGGVGETQVNREVRPII